MREIKFRAWDSNKKIMTEPFDIDNVPGDILTYSIVTEDIVMQYTGLKDKNGKEIYEGDLLKTGLPLDGKPHKVIWEVFWGKNENENMWGWMAKTNTGEYTLDDSLTERGEIIGNIYENPELLK